MVQSAKDATADAIRKAAKALVIKVPGLGGSKGKTYETWVMFEMASRIAQAHSVHVITEKGNKVATFYVRPSPTGLHAPSAAVNYTHFEFGTTHRFELHNGLEHAGRSDQTHELDISVIYKMHADLVRATGGGPYSGFRVMAAELKAHQVGALPKSMARALIGAAADLDVGTIRWDVELRINGQSQYTDGGYRPSYWLITTAALTAPTRDFLMHYRFNSAEGLTPSGNLLPLDELAVEASRFA